MTLATEQKRVIAKLEALTHERAPSTILDKCDADILLGYIKELQAANAWKALVATNQPPTLEAQQGKVWKLVTP